MWPAVLRGRVLGERFGGRDGDAAGDRPADPGIAAGEPPALPFPAHSYYAKLRQQEIERERELAEKYRDRAKERRDGVNKDYEETELISTTANYRAVGPTAEA